MPTSTPPLPGTARPVERRAPPGRGDGAGPDGRERPPAGPQAVRRPRQFRRWLPLLFGVVAASLVVRAGVRWWQGRQSALPAGIVYGNGRLEADEIDVDTKFAGRVAQLYASEGDLVHAGQLVARMDTRDLEASRRAALAQVAQADRLVDEMQANLQQQRSQLALAAKELDRYRELVARDFVDRETFDQRQQAFDAATASLSAADAKLQQALQSREAARQLAQVLDVNIRDDSLVAPRDARIQYRIANLGEVLPAGGKVFTMLDATSVYMDIYLPTRDAGRVRVGADSRIVLDAAPQQPIAARVSYLATEAQFTPKAVETQSDRDKLMFRVKLRIDSTALRGAEGDVRVGLPGVGYVRVDSAVAWPARLQGRPGAAPMP